MVRISPEQITTGMVFSLKRNDEFYFCREIGLSETGVGVNPPLESELTIVKPPYREVGGDHIDFTINGDSKHYTTQWQIFRSNTRLISEKPTTKKRVKKLTTPGPFNGFDINVRRTIIEDYRYLNFSALKVIIEFVGTGQRINAKLVNDIKASPGFADRLREVLLEELNSRKTKVLNTIEDYDPQKLDDFTKKYNRAPVETRFKNGRIAFVMYLTDEYDVIVENMEKQVERFVEVETKNPVK
ncbi:hypothetical protein [Oceanobacillus sp. CAU 1775]